MQLTNNPLTPSSPATWYFDHLTGHGCSTSVSDRCYLKLFRFTSSANSIPFSSFFFFFLSRVPSPFVFFPESSTAPASLSLPEETTKISERWFGDITSIGNILPVPLISSIPTNQSIASPSHNDWPSRLELSALLGCFACSSLSLLFFVFVLFIIVSFLS